MDMGNIFEEILEICIRFMLKHERNNSKSKIKSKNIEFIVFKL